MLHQSIFRTIRFLFALTIVAAALGGCDNSQDNFVFNGNNQVANGFTLNVRADPAVLAQGVLAQIGPDAVNFRVTVVDQIQNQVGQQTVPRNGTASFPDLPQGLYNVRIEGLNGGGTVVGYFDRFIFLNADTTTLMPGLRITNSPPPIGTQGNPFLILTASPTTAVGATAFSVTAQVFDNQGNPVTSAVTGVSLVANGLALEANPANQDTNAGGVVTFSNLRFLPNAAGTATITVDATGVDSVTSGNITVTAAPPFFQSLTRVSVQTDGTQGDQGGSETSLSADGRFVAFSSDSTNLLGAGVDTNAARDIFVLDRMTNTLERVSVADDGTQGDNDSSLPKLSADGRYVAFRSTATNLLGPGNDTNGSIDVFRYDRQTDTILRANVNNDGSENPSSAGRHSISGDGRFVGFSTSGDYAAGMDTNGTRDTYIRDFQGNTTEIVSLADDESLGNGPASDESSLSQDGRFVVFSSNASNLIGAGNDTNGVRDVFLRDRQNNTTERISVSSANVQGDGGSFAFSITPDGNFIAFDSEATNLVGNDTNARSDLFVRDRAAGTTERVSIADDGTQGNDDSRHDSSALPAMSADGRFVMMTTNASNLLGAGNDTNGTVDIMLYDRTNDTIARVTVTNTGAEANDPSSRGSISADGRIIAFGSGATNLVGAGNDTNGNFDAFVTVNPARR